MKKKKVKIEEGICKLTLKKGKFVDSHILPRALTILSLTGERAYQANIGHRTVRRFQGWYDNALAIDDGEKILSDIDNKAITLLRRNHLVWSGWPTIANSIPCDASQITRFDQHQGVRIIPNVDFRPIKVFFLSIVWRAAASSRDDMQHVSLDEDVLEKLRIATLNKDPLGKYDFPVRLHQIETRGVPHNRTPILEKQTFSLGSPFMDKEYLSCRIYMDGLIAHVLLDADEDYVNNMGLLNIGFGEEQGVMLNSFESSRAFDNLQLAINSSPNPPK